MVSPPTLTIACADRQDWFFGADMGIYYAPSEPEIVPDGFLSLSVERFIGEQGRLSYVLWEEDNIVPILALEVISKTYGGEYEKKKNIYAELGILYYIVYLPINRPRWKKPPLEVYRLVDNNYVPLEGEPVWLPEIGLGIGRAKGTYRGRTREWLYWYDREGNRLPSAEELAIVQQQRADRLAAKLREMGIDLD